MQKKDTTFSKIGEADSAPKTAVPSNEEVISGSSSSSSQHLFSPQNRRVRRRMAKQANERRVTAILRTEDLPTLVETHLRHFESGNFSPRTAQKKREFLQWFLRYMKMKGHTKCGVEELRDFFIYLKNSHLEPGGRWGMKGQKSTALRPSTINTYYRVLSAFFTWLVKEERLETNPLIKIEEPKIPRDQIQPLSPDQCRALKKAAEKSRDKARNSAIILLLLDCGLRASELCCLRLSDLDWSSCLIRVVGKGNKKRSVPFSPRTSKALWDYLQSEQVSPINFEEDDLVFHSQRGTQTWAGLERHGLTRLMSRLGKSAGVRGVMCSPHTLRHSFAVTYLREPAATVFGLQEILGHTDLKMIRRRCSVEGSGLLRVRGCRYNTKGRPDLRTP